ncbi:hypothetical protein D9M69_632770 [compost metagenome]
MAQINDREVQRVGFPSDLLRVGQVGLCIGEWADRQIQPVPGVGHLAVGLEQRTGVTSGVYGP